MFDIDLLPDAIEDLKWFRKSDQVIVRDQIEAILRHQADEETRNRKKLLPGHLSDWELRIDKARVFYNVDPEANLVTIVAIGCKERNTLSFRGKEYSP